MKGSFVHRPLAILLVIGATTLALTVGASGALAEDGDFGQPIDFLHNVNQAPAPVNGTVWAKGPKTATGTAICTTPTQTDANVNTDCEGTEPAQRDVDRGQPDQPAQHDRRRQRLPARRSTRAATSAETRPVARARDRSTAARPGRSTRSTPTPPTRPPVTRPSPSTPPATPTTRRSASGSSGRPTPRTRTSSSPTRGDGGKTWTSIADRRRAAATRPASATCSTRSTSRPGATATRSSRTATSGSARRARFISGRIYASRDPRRAARRGRAPTLISGTPRPSVRVGADRRRRRPDLRRVPQHDRPHDRPRRLRGRRGRARHRRAPRRPVQGRAR